MALTAKKLGKSDIIGAKGVALIQQIVFGMDFVFYPTGSVEAGIDGYIEIRQTSGEVTNFILQVQSKARERAFVAETPDSFEYLCDARDLNYWLHGNAPVILICSRTDLAEAYWVSVKGYFSDLKKLGSRKVVFDKKQDRFDASSKERLQSLAVPTSSGLYLGETPKQEIIYSNLLPVEGFPPRYFSARTGLSAKAFNVAISFGSDEEKCCVLNNKTVYSFNPLVSATWKPILEEGTVEEHPTEDWSKTPSVDQKRLFVQLLNKTFRRHMSERSIDYNDSVNIYVQRPSADLSAIHRSYTSRQNETETCTFRAYHSKKEPRNLLYYRHSAMEASFVRFAGEWFLQIIPTYRFTQDGYRSSRFAANGLKGIKKLEKNPGIHGQSLMWESLIKSGSDHSLFVSDEKLRLGSALRIPIDNGLDDTTWLPTKETNNDEDDSDQGRFDYEDVLD